MEDENDEEYGSSRRRESEGLAAENWIEFEGEERVWRNCRDGNNVNKCDVI